VVLDRRVRHRDEMQSAAAVAGDGRRVRALAVTRAEAAVVREHPVVTQRDVRHRLLYGVLVAGRGADEDAFVLRVLDDEALDRRAGAAGTDDVEARSIRRARRVEHGASLRD